MRRLWRGAVAMVGLLSVVLCAGTAILWYRSHQGPDYVHYTSVNQWALSVISGHGTVDVQVITHWPQEPELRAGRYDPYVYYSTRYSKRWMGFGTGLSGSGGRFVNVPHWFIACFSAGVALLCARALRRWWWRFADGCCQACGYDMRATPGRCPECGMAGIRSEDQ